MKLVKGLALGSAAAFALTGGVARAADLPGAEPVDYVKVCDIKGATGFFYIPGTETCLQIGGFVRFEATEVFNRHGDDDAANSYGMRTRARVWFDARTDTEYGALRTFIRLQFQRESGSPGTPGQSTGFDGDDYLYDQAFVQFAGLTAGVTDSFWDFKPYPTFAIPFVSDRTLPLIAYTAKFGDVSASVSAEDRTYRYRDATNASPNAGTEAPDIVANIRVKQGWGEAQISGVASYINPKKGFADSVGGVPNGGVGGDNEWGWGVQGGVKLNLPTASTSDGKGDFLWGQAGYVDGAGLSYVGLGDANVGSGRTQNITAFNPQRDYILINGDTEKTKAFNANLGALHYWSPQWRSALQGTYVDVNYRKLNADWSAWSVAGNLIWTPVKKLDIGAELVYVNTDYSNRASFPAGASKKDDDAFIGRLRVQRDF
jgi:hypothetical protein